MISQWVADVCVLSLLFAGLAVCWALLYVLYKLIKELTK